MDIPTAEIPVLVQALLWAGLLGGLFYFLLDCALVHGLLRLRRHDSGETPMVSVVVSARNEEATLENCLAHLFSQSCPKDRYEVLVADDRSTDKTDVILRRWQERHPDQLRVLRIPECPEGVSPKKHALAKLIELAKGEIVLATDADCQVPYGWVEAMARTFAPDTVMVAGLSVFPADTRRGWLLPVQALEFFSHGVIGAALIALGFPVTCTGNSLAYRKSFFLEVGGFSGDERVLSGDDDLLLQKAFRAHRRQVRFCSDPASFVTTAPQDSTFGFFNQRSRWASKTTRYSPPVVALFVAIFLWYCWIALTPLLGLLGLKLGSPWAGTVLAAGVAGFLWKTLWDGLVMARGAKLFGREKLMKAFPATAVLHIPMIVLPVVFGLCGLFRWKGSKKS